MTDLRGEIIEAGGAFVPGYMNANSDWCRAVGRLHRDGLLKRTVLIADMQEYGGIAFRYDLTEAGRRARLALTGVTEILT